MKMKVIPTIWVATIAVALLCVVQPAAPSDTITVTTTNDSGPGSLRQGLADAQNGETIVFSLGGAATISLTSSELSINKDIAITGPGAILLTIARAQDAPVFRIFHVAPGHTVTIQGVTITNGSALGFAVGGAGIWNDHSNLTVNNCVLTGNALDRQVSGGGISNDAGDSGSASLTINNSINSDADSDSNCDGHIYTYTDGYSHVYAYRHRNGHAHGHTNANANSYSYCNRYVDTDSYSNGDVYTNGHRDSNVYTNGNS